MAPVDLEFERTVLDGLGRILLTERDIEHAGLVAANVLRRPGGLLPVLSKHKVVTIAAANLDRIVARGAGVGADAARELRKLVEDAAREAHKHRAIIEEEAATFAGLLPRLGSREGDVAVLKGLCNARFYPAPYMRWMRDLDVFVATWESAMLLLDVLLEAGFGYDTKEHPWIKADEANGRPVYGQIFLLRPVGDDFSRVDIHFGTYSAGFSGYLQSSLTDRLQTVRAGSATLPVLRPERALLLAQAHALSDGYVAIKDVNDLVGAAVTQTVDWDELARSIRDHQLSPQTRALAEHIESLYDDQRVKTAMAALRESLPTGKRGWQVHNRDWTLRARVNANFTYRWHRSVGDSRLRSLKRGTQCYAFYIRRLTLAVRPRTWRERLLRRFMPDSDLEHWKLRPECCTLLIDVQSLGAASGFAGLPAVRTSEHPGAVEWISVDGHQLLRVRSRLYVPTLDLILDPSHALAAANFAARASKW